VRVVEVAAPRLHIGPAGFDRFKDVAVGKNHSANWSSPGVTQSKTRRIGKWFRRKVKLRE
jgi:hypothetical protein